MINKFKFLVFPFLFIASAQAATTVNYSPQLNVGTVEHFTITDSGGNDVTGNYSIQSIAADPVSGYTPAKSSAASRSVQAGSYQITFINNIDGTTLTDTANYTAVPAYIQLSSGAGQNASTGSVLPQPIKVQVSDASGNPISGATVTWTITGSGGTFSPSTTDASGIASTAIYSYTKAGVANTTFGGTGVFSVSNNISNIIPTASYIYIGGAQGGTGGNTTGVINQSGGPGGGGSAGAVLVYYKGNATVNISAIAGVSGPGGNPGTAPPTLTGAGFYNYGAAGSAGNFGPALKIIH